MKAAEINQEGSRMRRRTMRVKYNRASIESTGSAAEKLTRSTGDTHYVYATYYGYTITKEAPTFQGHFKCELVNGKIKVTIID